MQENDTDEIKIQSIQTVSPATSSVRLRVGNWADGNSPWKSNVDRRVREPSRTDLSLDSSVQISYERSIHTADITVGHFSILDQSKQ
jgi:hypothetical protein